MSVIGYDGKIRPKSVAVNYKPQGMVTPEMMERIHAAKPDYVKGVMKMFDSFNKNMDDTIGYFDEERKKREAAEHAEEKFRVDQQLSEIENNPDLTPEQKKAKTDEVKAAVSAKNPVGKGSVTERFNALDLQKDIHRATVQIQREDNRQKEAIRAAGLEAGLNTIIKNASTELQPWMTEKVRENPNLELNDLRGLLEERFDGFAGPDATNGLKPLDLANYNKNREAWIGTNLVVFGKIHGDIKREKNKLDIAISSYATAETAPDAAAAWVSGYGVAGKYVGSTIDEHEQIQNANGTAITWIKRQADKAVTEHDRIIANISDAYASKVDELGAEGAAQWAAAEMERAKKLLFDARNLVQLSFDDAYKKLDEVHGIKLMDAEKNYYKTFFQDNADALKKQLDKTTAQKNVAAASTVKKAEKEKGMNDFVAMKDFFSGKSTDLPEHLIPIYRKFDPNAFGVLEEAAQAEGYTKEMREKMQNIILNERYAGLSTGDRDLAFVYDCMGAIAGLDMNRNSAQNLYDIQAIMDSVGRLYGYDSDQYKEVAKFAFENMQKEKNGMGNQAVAHANRIFLNGHTPSSKEGQEILNSNPALRKRYVQFVTLAQELPYDGSAWFDKVGELETVARQMKAFDGITTAAGFQQGVLAAFDTARKMPNEKMAAATEGGAPWVKETDAEMAKLEEEAEKESAKVALEYAEKHPEASAQRINYVKSEGYRKWWYKKSREVLPWYELFTAGDVNQWGINKAYIRRHINNRTREEYERSTQAQRDKSELAKLERLLSERGLYQKYAVGIENTEEGFGRELPIEARIRVAKNMIAKHDEDAAEKKQRSEIVANLEKIVGIKSETKERFAEYAAGEQAVEANGKRTDGTTKGPGWFGKIDLGKGKFATELSVTTEVDGVRVDIPLVNPLLTKQELDVLIRMEKVGKEKLSEEDKKALEGIYDKAFEWAKQRWSQNKSPYIMKGESVLPLPKDEEGGEKK